MWFSIDAKRTPSSRRLHHVFESSGSASPDSRITRADIPCASIRLFGRILWLRSIIPINPHPLLLAEGGARIDIAIERPSGSRRHALVIGGIGAVAGDADTATLEAIGVIIGRRRRTADGGSNCRRRQRQ